jgi:hypothetical protein
MGVGVNPNTTNITNTTKQTQMTKSKSKGFEARLLVAFSNRVSQPFYETSFTNETMRAIKRRNFELLFAITVINPY